MIIVILIVLILMNGIGYFNSPAAPGGYRYGWGGLGLILLILLILMVLHLIPGV